MSRQTYRGWLELSRIPRRKAIGLAAAGAGTLALLTACGRGKNSAGEASPVSGTQANKPATGGMLAVGISDDPQTFDPSAQRTDTGRIMLWTNDSLLSYKSGSAVKYEEMLVQPGLAERRESPDAQTYTFHLHNDIRFANLPPVNGRALTAEDIKWTYEYLSRSGQVAGRKLPPSVVGAMLAGLDQIQTPDPNTAVVKFQAPYAPFVSYVASQWLPILAHEIFDADGDLSKRSVGTGPFQLDPTASQRGSRWVFKKNPTYYRSGLPYLDQITELILPEDATQDAAFQSKQLDILNYGGLPLDTVDRIKKAVPDAVRYDHLWTSYYHLDINVSVPPLNDQRVRQAISRCIDRDAFIKTFSNGQGQWALAASTPGLFTDTQIKQILKYDPAQAKQLVNQAGYPNGVDLEFIYGTFYGNEFVSILQLFQSQMRQGNINITLKLLDHTAEHDRRHSGSYQLAMVPRPSGFPLEEDSMLYGMFYPNLASNDGRVNDPQLTQLLVQQRQETDPAKRRDLWRQAIRRVNEVPWALGLFFGIRSELWYPAVKNYAPNMSAESEGMYLTDAWVTR
jgi:peptide/nickel transport system substrate-binding protein